MNTPRILDLTGTPHPRALVQSIDAATGVCVFAWLDAQGERVDSGGSVARFTPQWTFVEGVTESVPVEPTDEILADAIANPPPEMVPVPASVTRRQLFLWLNGLGITRAALRTQLAGNEAALIELEEPQEFQRIHPLVAQLGAVLGLDSDAIDGAFRAAAKL